MGDLISGHQLGDKLKDMLGLPKHTRGFELRCYVNEVVTIKCEYYPEIDGIEQLESVIKEQCLVEKESEKEKEVKVCCVCGNPATTEVYYKEGGETKYYCDLHKSCGKIEMGEDDVISNNTK